MRPQQRDLFLPSKSAKSSIFKTDDSGKIKRERDHHETKEWLKARNHANKEAVLFFKNESDDPHRSPCRAAGRRPGCQLPGRDQVAAALTTTGGANESSEAAST